MKRKFLLIMALSIFLIAGLARAGQTTISFMNWSSTEDSMKSILDVIADFEKENPDIKVKNVPIGVGDIRNQFMVMNLGGNPPDVCQMNGADAVYVFYSGALHAVEDLFPPEFVDNFVPTFYDETRVGDKHAAVLWGPQTLTFVYNKKILARIGYSEPPKTIEEMEEMMKKAKETIPDVIGLQLDTTIRPLGLAHQWAWMNTFDYEFIKDKASRFNSDAMIQFGEWIRRIVKNGYTLPGKKFGEFRPMAAQGRVLFCWDVSHRAQMMAFRKGMTEAEYNDIFAAAFLPAGPTGKHLASPEDHALVISSKTKNKEAAVKFVRYLTESQSALTKYLDTAGFLPPVKNYGEVAPGAFEDASRQGTMKYAVPYIVNPPFGPKYVPLAQEVTTAVQEIITTEKPVKQILDAYQAKIEGILK